ncbi:hypothetical protein P3T18_004652 [Paraburkholderia sp. GAS199]|uniref:acyl-CoA dehydrogenase n=1 Tax=Paraburkholderia sp. GAS199 TaxID=3035126 RepID=UPI003D1BF046
MLDMDDRAAGVGMPMHRPIPASGARGSGKVGLRDAQLPSGVAPTAASLQRFLDDAIFAAEAHATAPASAATALGAMLEALIERGYDRAPFMPLPGDGDTTARWATLAAVAARDLGLVKLFEGHTDALAILAELRGPTPPAGSRWGVWAAEPPDARVQATLAGAVASPMQKLTLNGTKSWCSGASVLSHALVTVWLSDGTDSGANREPMLAAVALDDPSISIDTSAWQAVGMQATASADVSFADTPATLIGGAHAYVRRPGFWHGGAGIAACWFGAAAQIGEMLLDASAQRADAHRLAHLGAVDVALSGAAALLRETAALIDAHPRADLQRECVRARLAVEEAASAVMTHATRTLGAGPLCRDARFARLLADLPVFLRQSHAERDLAGLGESVVQKHRADVGDAADADHPWTLGQRREGR